MYLTFPASSSTLKILQINIRGINNYDKLDSLAMFVENLNTVVDVLVVGETWIKEDRATFYNITGFTSIHSCRKNSSGGLAVFIRNGLQFDIKNNASINGYHHIEIMVLIGHSHFYIHGIYRPPDYDMPRFHGFLEEILSSSDPMSPTFIMGDINVAVNKSNESAVEQYNNLLNSYNMCVTNTIVTRPGSGNILDHVIAREDDVERMQNYTIDCDLSDHNYILTVYVLSHKKADRKILTKSETNHRLLNIQFSEFLSNTQFYELGPNARLAAISGKYKELKLAHTVVHTVEVKVKKTNCPWFNFDVWSLGRKRDKLLRRRNRNRQDMQLSAQLEDANRKLAMAKRKAKMEYHRMLFNTNNPKLLWQRINEVLGKNSKKQKITLEVDGNDVFESELVANIFNDHFTSIGENLARQLQSSGDINKYNTIHRCPNSIFLRPASSEEVSSIIAGMDPNKATGYDELPISVIQQHVNHFSTILASTFNDSISLGTYPEFLKIALVHPIHKSGNSRKLDNYRPISVLPSMNKVFESMLSSRITSFLHDNNFFCPNQHGFRKGASTEVAVLDLVNELSNNIDQKKQLAGTIFLDLSKAFDTLNHDLMLKKLDAYGIRGLPNDFLRSYLSNRRQQVYANGVLSTQRQLNVGVPQGSSMGPLLFLVYINDLSNLKLHGVPRLFADDTAVSYAEQNINNIILRMTEDLVTIHKFLENNLLSLNANKTKMMIFRTSRTILPPHSNVSLRGVVIEEVDSYKYLGIYIDNHLSWKQHISNLTKNCSSICGLFRKLSHFLPRHVLMKIYFSFVHSRYQYGVCIWGAVTAPQLKSLQVQQNRCIKAIFHLPHLFSTLELYRALNHNILPVVALHEFQTVVLMHRLTQIKDIHNNFSFRTSSHQQGTRNAGRIIIASFSTEIGRRRFTCCGPRLYNNLPPNIKNSATIHVLKRMLKERLRNDLERFF